MSLSLMLLARPSIQLTKDSLRRLPLLRASLFPIRCNMLEMSSLKPNYKSTRKLSPEKSSGFDDAVDDKSRRLQLQQLIAFRDKHSLQSDYELIYSIPRPKLQESMHFFCVFICTGIIVCIVLYHYQDIIDIGAINDHLRQDMPSWTIYAMSLICLSIFLAVLFMISFVPTRLLYSPNRKSYALFYQPMFSVFNQKKVIFNHDQYIIKTNHGATNIPSNHRAIEIQLKLPGRILLSRRSFYLMEDLFRSRQDILRLQSHDSIPNRIETERSPVKQIENQENDDLWRTVVEKKNQQGRAP